MIKGIFVVARLAHIQERPSLLKENAPHEAGRFLLLAGTVRPAEFWIGGLSSPGPVIQHRILRNRWCHERSSLDHLLS